MQSKTDLLFNFKLSDQPNPISTHLSNNDLKNLCMTSKYYFALFKPVLMTRNLLYSVARGEYKRVKEILNQDINLIFKKDKLEDCSGRNFAKISAFEYALWALDKHMWTAMITCIPQNEEGRRVFSILLDQYNAAHKDGVIYKLNEKTICEKHFDFENTIIKELKTNRDSTWSLGVKDWAAISKQWLEGVGGAQRLLPMHVVDEYCSSKTFYSHNPLGLGYEEFSLPPNSSKQFYNELTGKNEYWFSRDSRLGTEFAIYKTLQVSSEEIAVLVNGAPFCIVEWGFDDNGAAMTRLYETRTNDFVNLKSQLEVHIALLNNVPKL